MVGGACPCGDILVPRIQPDKNVGPTIKTLKMYECTRGRVRYNNTLQAGTLARAHKSQQLSFSNLLVL